MEILVGLGVILAIAWLAIGPMVEPEPESLLGFFFVIPWLALVLAVATGIAYGIGRLVLIVLNA